MINHFKDLLAYSLWCNQKIIQAMMKNAKAQSEKSLYLMSHIINAHQIWNGRIDKNDHPFGVFQVHPLAALATLDQHNFDATGYILETKLLKETISFQDTEGIHYTNKMSDILFHIINHSTYHRAQLATEFRSLNIEPIRTDFILFKR